MLPLFVIDPEAPFAQTAGRPAGCIRSNFVLESIHELDTKLRQMKSELVVILGKPELVIPRIIPIIGANSLYYEQEAAHPVRQADRAVLTAIRASFKNDNESSSFKIKGFPTHTLHPMESYLAKCKSNVAPTTYGGFKKLFDSMKVPNVVETVNEVPPLPTNALYRLKEEFKDAMQIPDLAALGYSNIEDQLKNRRKGGIDFEGGEDAGLELLHKMMSRHQWVAKFEKPETSPNALTVDTTGLSPYVKHGCLSPRLFYHELSKVYSRFNAKELSKPPVSLHGQLMWREYNYLMGYSTPNFDKMIDNPVARQIPWDDDPDLLAAWREARTGYPFIDAIMTQLRETGWIHHLARHAVACFLTRGDLWQSWEKGAEVFEEYLIDADWSINNFNWQWLSCTAHFYQYFRCYSPISFGKKTDKNGDYIRKWLPQFRNFPTKYIYEPWEAPLEVQRKYGVVVGETYPLPIVEHKSVSKSNMNRMKEAYDAQKNGESMPSHGRNNVAQNDAGNVVEADNGRSPKRRRTTGR